MAHLHRVLTFAIDFSKYRVLTFAIDLPHPLFVESDYDHPLCQSG